MSQCHPNKFHFFNHVLWSPDCALGLGTAVIISDLISEQSASLFPVVKAEA